MDGFGLGRRTKCLGETWVFSGDTMYEGVVVDDPKNRGYSFFLVDSIFYRVRVGVSKVGYNLVRTVREDIYKEVNNCWW